MSDSGDIALSAEKDGMDERRWFEETAQEEYSCCDEAKQDCEVVRNQMIADGEPGCHGRREQRARRRTRQPRILVSKLIQIPSFPLPPTIPAWLTQNDPTTAVL